MTKKDKENLIKAAHAGGAVLKKYFGKTLNLVQKSTIVDFQTEADLGSEKAILTILKKEFPKYNTHSEEGGKFHNGSDYTFVIDPLDGTNNFVLGIPNFCVSIALFHKERAIAGIIYQPLLDQTYFAELGKGAKLNGKKIKVSKLTQLNKISIAYTGGYLTSHDRFRSMLNNLMKLEQKRILFNWCPTFDCCLVASGKIESLVSDYGLELHDFGAGKLIAQEAGAQVIDMKDGKKEANYKNDGFIISNNSKNNNYIFNNAVKLAQKGRVLKHN